MAIRPNGEEFQLPNAIGVTLVVLEATGGLEYQVSGSLLEAGIATVIVNPRQVRAFAKVSGKRAKTDRLDAAVLAHFGEVIRPQVRSLPDAQLQQLSEVVVRRRQLVEMLSAEQNRQAQRYRPLSDPLADLQCRSALTIKTIRSPLTPLSFSYPLPPHSIIED